MSRERNSESEDYCSKTAANFQKISEAEDEKTGTTCTDAWTCPTNPKTPKVLFTFKCVYGYIICIYIYTYYIYMYIYIHTLLQTFSQDNGFGAHAVWCPNWSGSHPFEPQGAGNRGIAIPIQCIPGLHETYLFKVPENEFCKVIWGQGLA